MLQVSWISDSQEQILLNCIAVHNILHNSVVLALYVSLNTLSLWLDCELLEDRSHILFYFASSCLEVGVNYIRDGSSDHLDNTAI